jgi:hypothetical protein
VHIAEDIDATKFGPQRPLVEERSEDVEILSVGLHREAGDRLGDEDREQASGEDPPERTDPPVRGVAAELDQRALS